MTAVLDTDNLAALASTPPSLGPYALLSLVCEVAANEAAWLPHLQLPSDGQRWWGRLHTDAHVDVWLLSWLPGQTTDLHDHGASAAGFTVVRGVLQELRVASTGPQRAIRHRPGAPAYVAPALVHDVHAVAGTPAVSIHAYSPPLTRMTYYEREPSGALHVSRTVATHEPEQELQR
jgi:predicted metal-dependent enzyme (double-stranded beta helix superfamily)